MNALTNPQIINDKQGNPAFVVMPYDEYLQLKNIDLENGVPSEVVDIMFDKNCSAVRAWREYLNLTQAEVARKLDISQSAYSQYEASERLRKSTREKIAEALGINYQQLDI